MLNAERYLTSEYAVWRIQGAASHHQPILMENNVIHNSKIHQKNPLQEARLHFL